MVRALTTHKSLQIYPEVALATVSSTSNDNARVVLDWLFEKGFLEATYTEEQLVAA